jgi:hypothetical protein
MSDKSTGFDFDRTAFVPPQPVSSGYTPRIGVFILFLGALAAIAFLAYRMASRSAGGAESAGDPALADIDKRLGAIEGRLEKLETAHTVPVPVWEDPPADLKQPAPKLAAKANNKIVSAPPQPVQEAVPTVQAPDPATARRLSSLQQGLGALQNDQLANREAWQAATNRMAELQGQVGEQGVEILQSQDELNQLLARTETDAIPFELLRGASPQQVGPVSLFLKASNPKTQRYTLCAFAQSTCIELKDRSLHEVVQFVPARNSPPLGIIATKIMKYQILGYLEVPRNLSAK